MGVDLIPYFHCEPHLRIFGRSSASIFIGARTRCRRSKGQYHVGEIQNQPFQFSFNTSRKIDFQGSRVTSDGGLVLVGEINERLSFGEIVEQHLRDARRGKNMLFPLADLLRQSVSSRFSP